MVSATKPWLESREAAGIRADISHWHRLPLAHWVQRPRDLRDVWVSWAQQPLGFWLCLQGASWRSPLPSIPSQRGQGVRLPLPLLPRLCKQVCVLWIGREPCRRGRALRVCARHIAWKGVRIAKAGTLSALLPSVCQQLAQCLAYTGSQMNVSGKPNEACEGVTIIPITQRQQPPALAAIPAMPDALVNTCLSSPPPARP